MLRKSIELANRPKIILALPSSVEALDTKKYEKSGEFDSCPVCLEEFMTGVDVTTMPFSHIFHKGCIVQWLGSWYTCPMCRFEMPKSLPC
ncbi:hypothetical protein GIB67_023124 [Kingdonia uniflora]|uniref:RING-type domain-containing protein n=1 Tax=Kingdonia uniflora TaxID=39325 RepID=A0A7J7M5L0_9MAGN|nr:hypothetical protein GIB67_023124 [Kingdonia uniflora]